MVLAACGQNAAAPSSGGAPSAAPAASGVKVGVILPETQSSARWEGFDKPLLTAAMQAEGLDADIQNAQGDEQKFSTLADGMISSGVKVLVIASISSESGAAVAAKAKAQGIPTSYDRLSSAQHYRVVRQREGRRAAGPGPGRRPEGQAGRAGHRDRGCADGQQRDAVLQRRELRA
jgi:ABC-type xylose transport system substrate-binding protein